MRCQACDCLLNFFESTRKSVNTQEYIDLCTECFVLSGITEITDNGVNERYDLEGVDERYRGDSFDNDTDGDEG